MINRQSHIFSSNLGMVVHIVIKFILSYDFELCMYKNLQNHTWNITYSNHIFFYIPPVDKLCNYFFNCTDFVLVLKKSHSIMKPLSRQLLIPNYRNRWREL